MNFALSRSPISWPLAERAWGSPVAKEDSRLVSCDEPCDSLGLAGLPKLFPLGLVEWKGTDLDSSEMGSQSQPGLLPPAVTLSCPGCSQEGPGLARLDKGEAPLTVPCLLSQLEEFLNQSSPFYLWINGDRIDSLLENDRQQGHVMDVMEDSFNRASNIMDELFQDRFFPRKFQDTQYYSPFSSFPRGSLFFNPKSRLARNVMPFPVLEPLNFHDMFQPFFDMIHQAQQAMDAHMHRIPYHFPMAEFPGG